MRKLLLKTYQKKYLIKLKAMRNYQSLEEIELDLKRLNLERQIAIEELKLTKYNLEEHLKPINLVGNFLKFASKYGLLILIKRFFK